MSYFDQAMQAREVQDYETARKIFTRLAEFNGNLDARFMLGMMSSLGEGSPQNPAEAARHYRIAAEAGHTSSQHNLAALYALGRGVPQDYREAIGWYRQAADRGHTAAQVKVGVMYANGQGVDQDCDEAESYWRRAADKQHLEALLFLGHLYSNGDGRDREPITATNWYLKAWNAGSEEALPYLIELLPTLKQAAAQGSSEAQNLIGIFYKFVQHNDQEALRWFSQAAAQNQPEALRLLGYSYQHGEGITQNLKQAAILYGRAAQRGDKIAQYNLGVFYAEGIGGLEQSLDQAIDWYRQAADQSVLEAQQPLAELLAYRNRDRADAIEAFQRLLLVAQNSPEEAEYQLTAGDGEWSMTIKQQGKLVQVEGIKFDILSRGFHTHEGSDR